jgi:arsenate reductase
VSFEIWHNPRCSKSRQTLALLEDKGITPTIRLYLQESPTSAELHDMLEVLGLTARDILRAKEPQAREAGIDTSTGNDAIIEAMVQFPKLIERPIVRAGDKAVLGRPPENVLDLI